MENKNPQRSFSDFVEIMKKEYPNSDKFRLAYLDTPPNELIINHRRRNNVWKTHSNALILLGKLKSGDKCAVAAMDIEKFKAEFTRITGHEIKSSPLGNDIYSVVLNGSVD
ncbi:hypothetical protein [Sunxiuqinia indica]|uniref:hypothetical protein n=1 Tax=Sunxiuqinia indica TaxID=2692584 RepID=UPI00135BD0A5|nr:hypothetical protein [Sunxiuqinia indica]